MELSGNEVHRLFFRYIRMGLWKKKEEVCQERSLSQEVWEHLFRMAHSQAVTGLFIDGVAQENMRPDNDLWDKWVAHLFYLEQANRYIARRGEAWMEKLAGAGLSATIFKGASVAAWYPEPLHRSPGDIDIVITDGWGKLKVFLTREGWNPDRSNEDEMILEEKNQLLVEFHRHWEYLYNPWTNGRLQQWCREAQPDDKEVYFVCLVLHIQRHFLTYGIGLKQVCDVAVMLRKASLDRDKVAMMLCALHAERFSRLLFGLIALHLGGLEQYPLPPITEGKELELLNDSVLHDGYNLKMEQELTAGSKNWAVARIASNAAFWVKRCVVLFPIMPGEAFGFLLHKVFKRLKNIRGNK